MALQLLVPICLLCTTRKCFNFMHVLLLLHLLLPLNPVTSAHQDIFTLLQFKKGIKHDPSGSIFESWNEESIDFNGCPSSWFGIVCNGRNVASISLNNLKLSGEVNLGILSNLSILVHLSLSNNSLSGLLPPKMGNFANIQHLDISNNVFHGEIPPDIGRLHNLKNLSLANNGFTGSIPSTIQNLGTLEWMDLSSNYLTGLIPTGLDRLLNLRVLDLHQNQLSGGVDHAVKLFPSAVYVDLSGNSFLGPIPWRMAFGSVGSAFALEYLNLSKNQVSGPIMYSDDIPLFNSLKVLDLSHNQLSGELPGFQFVYALEVLNLGSNQFSGSLPNELLRQDSLVLTDLDLSANNLSGPLDMITSTTLRNLNLSSNLLSGNLPSKIGSCTIVDLSRNRFTGSLSVITAWNDNVEVLDLSCNYLFGLIPLDALVFLRLSYLNISFNSLGGPIASIMPHYPKLQALDLCSNHFNGSLPTNLLASPTVKKLYLCNNNFSGAFPKSVSSNPSDPMFYHSIPLQELDLSNNQLDGHIPREIGFMGDLRRLVISRNRFSGLLPSEVSNLSVLNTLDLSVNQFTGLLPAGLPDSLNYFNASYNDFSGSVPSNLMKFPQTSFYPGNSKLLFPLQTPSSNEGAPMVVGSLGPQRKSVNRGVKVAVTLGCAVGVSMLLLVAFIFHRKRASYTSDRSDIDNFSNVYPSNGPFAKVPLHSTSGGYSDPKSSPLVSLIVSSEHILSPIKDPAIGFKSQGTEVDIPMGFSPPRASEEENHRVLGAYPPDRLAGDLVCLDETMFLTSEELSRAPAEVLGRSIHGTSYRAILDGGHSLTVKWLRDGMAKSEKEFRREAKKLGNVRHMNVVPIRGYYWGPGQHERLLLSDYVSPGSLANYLFDLPSRRTPPLMWSQRLKIAADVARGLNYLHLDKALPHGNICASNILLDGTELQARISDYALHQLTSSPTFPIHPPPEISSKKKPKPSFKADTYAFGMVLIELLTGKDTSEFSREISAGRKSGQVEPGSLMDWVRRLVEEEHGTQCFDGALVDVEEECEAMKRVLAIAMRCVLPANVRPSIKVVYEEISTL
ncbi:probable LRR receptor-like serine/threonine-protein kinase At4g20940 [Amborella trichopoda]|uniref:Protein kinase domain-containing protein n=1 Tax=Amborella trichopoda TaxID=13333 RepID=U5D6I4_AMBTC|nr:probable LRR receptor-like serine/threonine-protein kinase At4g20940 [Amborella trichopoda]ERN15978.1 hypothetical protein AMTR_s00175p00060970 [Amborella trichopoda]|eukprot:XP_020529301.1 probable LRR receptor-like serine/threonine-protein kinase At4g20940 [Amborella trichopoda]